MPVLTRRRAIGALGFGCAVPVLYGGLVEPRWIERSFTKCRLPHLLKPVRILHLSDLHASPVVPQSVIDEAINLGLETSPDLVAATGDFVTHGMGFDRDWYVSALRRLSRRAPVLACLGNHDGGAWAGPRNGFTSTGEIAALLADSGIRLLHNSAESITVRGQRIQVTGLADLWSREMDANAAFANVDDTRNPVILLAHNPDTKDRLPTRAVWHLMLSGHTHGGQVRVTGITELMTPVQDKRYLAGLKPWNGRLVYVTRGVGNIAGVRFNCRPEISILDLTP